jgi:hypothetical protein
VVTKASTTTALSSAPNPSVSGQSVTLTATVAAVSPGSGTPTGTVEFWNGTAVVGTGALTGGTASVSTSELPAGTRRLTARYVGSTSFTASTSPAASHVVTKASTTTALSSAPNPSVSGQSVTLTATVAAVSPGSGTPTGSVRFFNGTSSLGTGTLSGGTATLSTTALPAGTRSLTARYVGSTSFDASTSPAVSHIVQAATTAMATASRTVIHPGDVVTLTATVTSTDGLPSGSLRFKHRSETIGDMALNDGMATYQASELPIGEHVIAVAYMGSATHKPASATVNVRVDPRIGPEFVVNSTTEGSQDRAQIARLRSGRIAVAWQSSRTRPEPDSSIHLQFFDTAGERSGDEARVSRPAAGAQVTPALAPLKSGGLVVVWHSEGVEGVGSGIFGRIYRPTEEPRGDQFQIDDRPYGPGGHPVVVATETGFLVVWLGANEAGDSEIRARLFTSTGRAIGGTVRVTAALTGKQRFPAVTTIGNDDAGFVVAWQTEVGGVPNIYFQRLDAALHRLGDAIAVTAYSHVRQLDPRLTRLSDGSFVVSWAEDVVAGLDVLSQRYDAASGVALGSASVVNTRILGTQRAPGVAALPSGGHVVTWSSYNQDGSGYGVYAQRFDQAGAKADAEFQVNRSMDGNQWLSDIVALSDDTLVAVWTSGHDIGRGAPNNIMGQRLRVMAPIGGASRQARPVHVAE